MFFIKDNIISKGKEGWYFKRLRYMYKKISKSIATSTAAAAASTVLVESFDESRKFLIVVAGEHLDELATRVHLKRRHGFDLGQLGGHAELSIVDVDAHELDVRVGVRERAKYRIDSFTRWT